MEFDDIKRIFKRSVLLSLDQIITPRLIKLAYLLGLAAIALWAISHLVGTFSLGFAEGIWGLLELFVFGLSALIGLRVVCEVLIVYFRTHEAATQPMSDVTSASLIDEVRDAIEDLAGEEDAPVDQVAQKASVTRRKPPAKTSSAPAKKPAARKTTPRTAKRTPKQSG